MHNAGGRGGPQVGPAARQAPVLTRPPSHLPAAQPSKVDADQTTAAVHPAPAAVAVKPGPPAQPARSPPPKQPAVAAAKQPPAAASSEGSEAGERIAVAPAPAAGGAAILAKLRAQREAKARAAGAGAAKEVVVLYASQTGTAQEIAKGVQAEAAAQGLKAKVRAARSARRALLQTLGSQLLAASCRQTGRAHLSSHGSSYRASPWSRAGGLHERVRL